jgi:ribonuclease I
MYFSTTRAGAFNLNASVAVPIFDENGCRRTREQIAKLATDMNASNNGGYAADTYSHNYVMDLIESRRHKMRKNDCSETLRKNAMRARLQAKLSNQIQV